MFINAGLGSIDEYPVYADAGADEVFCGYVPDLWTDRFGPHTPLNRREVLYYNVQIGSISELRILKKMEGTYRKPVSIVFNALSYSEAQLCCIHEIMRQCILEGFHTFIVADPALLLYLKQHPLPGHASIIVSGETGEINPSFMDWCRTFPVSGMIFHRKLQLHDISACIAWDRSRHAQGSFRYEAFILNELCHYTGAFCSSLHCDEYAPMCRVPYRLSGPFAERSCHAPSNSTDSLLGASGCGLCALWRLQNIGVTHLKLVSRGNYAEATRRDILALRHALGLLGQSSSEQAYVQKMTRELFPDGCSGNCYYPEFLRTPCSDL